MKQKLLIAIALGRDAKVLVMDERQPTSTRKRARYSSNSSPNDRKT